MRSVKTLLAVAFAANLFLACDDEGESEGHHEHTECTAGETRCVEEGAQTCNDEGHWDAAQACAEGEMCMTMPSGLSHCMVPMVETPQALSYVFSADAAQNTWSVTVVDSAAETHQVAQFDLTELAALSAPEADGGNGAGPNWGDAIASTDGKRVFVNAVSVNKVAVFDTQTHTLEALIDVGGRPVHNWNPNHGDEIWVHSDAEGAFYVIDQHSLAVSGPLTAALTGTGHGKLLYAAELGTDYFATNTNDPGAFPIDGANQQVGAIIELCGQPCEDDPETDEDEAQNTCGGTHDKAYNPGANLAVFQCTGGAGYAFVNAETHEVVQDKVAISGSIAHTPDNAFILAINARAESAQVQIWDTAADEHDGVTFDRTVDVDGAPSARGTHFYKTEAGEWEAWIPQTSGTRLAVVNLNHGHVEWVEIGTLTAPEGASHFSRRGGIDGEHFITYNDDGLVLINLKTRAPMAGPSLNGLASRIASVAHHETHAEDDSHEDADMHAGHEGH